MSPAVNKALREGLADALGFVIGGTVGRQAGLAFGFDFFGSPHWGAPEIVALVLIAAGCGIGRIIFRRLLLNNKDRKP